MVEKVTSASTASLASMRGSSVRYSPDRRRSTAAFAVPSAPSPWRAALLEAQMCATLLSASVKELAVG